MPKIKDFIEPVKVIATYANPVAGAVVSIMETAFVKPTKKVTNMLDGKKTYIGLAVTALAFIAQLLGYDVPIEAKEGVETSLSEMVISLGTLLASVGLVHNADKANKKQ